MFFLVLVIGVLLRFRHLTSGLVESHSWRQADVAMIASNFYSNGFDIFHPQIDWAGPFPGYIGMEFPLVPYLMALLYALFGEHLFLGRLLSISFCALSAYYFYLLVRSYFTKRAALISLFFFLFSPLSVFFSRTLISDNAMLCFSIGAIYFFSQWTRNEKTLHFALSLIFAIFALLVKIPAAIIGLPIAYLAWNKFGWSFLRMIRLWVFGFMVVIPSILWYVHAFTLARNNYPFVMFGEENWVWYTGFGTFLEAALLKKVFVRLAAFLVTPVGLIMSIVGAIITAWNKPGTYLFHWWVAGFFVFFIIGFPGQKHEYYQLQLLPGASLFAALFCDEFIKHRGVFKSWILKPGLQTVIVICLVVGFLVSSLALVETRYHSSIDKILHEGGLSVQSIVPANALILAADWNNPVLIQSSKRRGWHFPGFKTDNDRVRTWSVSILEKRRTEGASYFVAPVKLDMNRQIASESFLQLFGRRILPPSDLDFLESHTTFKKYLDSRYKKVLSNRFVVVYDLRANTNM
ncbi:MAG TPA: glycosyltransferase family 39 protein [Thermodesulfobacteriota bacterium]|nr:glycosyltransferase family 39 protein [Thermodesulfobacteriota bacterium]